jgi:hypothetical protein
LAFEPHVFEGRRAGAVVYLLDLLAICGKG